MTKFTGLKKLFGQPLSSAESLDWEEAYAEIMPRVYNFFRYRFFNNDTAEDLTSVTMSRAWQSRNRFKPEIARFSTWVMGIARHVAIDELRRKKVDELPLEDHPFIIGDQGVESLIQEKQHLAELKQMLAELSPAEQELIGLKYGAGLNNREIAQINGMSESNVGTTLHRTVKKLRSKMGIKL